MLRTLAGDFSIASLLAGQIALVHLAAGRWLRLSGQTR